MAAMTSAAMPKLEIPRLEMPKLFEDEAEGDKTTGPSSRGVQDPGEPARGDDCQETAGDDRAWEPTATYPFSLKKHRPGGYERGVCAASRCNNPSILTDATRKVVNEDVPLCDRHWEMACDDD